MRGPIGRLSCVCASLMVVGIGLARAETVPVEPADPPSPYGANGYDVGGLAIFGAGWDADFDFDGDVDLEDFLAFAHCFNGPNRPPADGCAVDADFNGDSDVDLEDFLTFSLCFNGPNRPPASSTVPRLADYSHSSCLSQLDEQAPEGFYAVCPDDAFRIDVNGNTFQVTHFNATYNCCLDDIRVSLTWVGPRSLRLTEEEVASVPCRCICCYDVQASVTDLAPGTYQVEVCWNDFDAGGMRCDRQEAVIP